MIVSENDPDRCGSDVGGVRHARATV